MSRSEFKLISEIFAPISDLVRGRGLVDDAALFSSSPGHDIITTADSIVQGVHFLADDRPADIARKALRVNLSDIAAMGGTPRHYLLTLALPKTLDDAWLEAFAGGLASDHEKYSVSLLGGDTVTTPGPLTITIACFGEVRVGRAIARNMALPVDDIYVSGTIGDSMLGLEMLGGRLQASSELLDYFSRCYRLPEPQCSLGPRLVGMANAAIDVSDGLMADLEHICNASKVRARISLATIPLSDFAFGYVQKKSDLFFRLLAAGDDYQIIFTANAELRRSISDLSAELGVSITRIGVMEEGRGVVLQDEDGQTVRMATGGYTHR